MSIGRSCAALCERQRTTLPLAAILALLAFASQPALANEAVMLLHAPNQPQPAFAAAEIRKALEARGDMCVAKGLNDLAPNPATTRIILAASPQESDRIAAALHLAKPKGDAPQSYAIRKVTLGPQTTYIIFGADRVGAMYGGLDLAEAIRLGTLAELKDSEHSPHITHRELKLNIPLDRRTPTYSDNGDSGQANIPEVWNLNFWQTYFDEMARHRFNVLSLWNLHPFPSIVKVPEYPDVALADAWGNKQPFDLNFDMNSPAMSKPFQLKSVEVVKKMTIDDKIKFWRQVMQMANDRGIGIYWFTWNTFVWGTEGKYGLTEDGNNQKTITYFRASVRETVRTYPLLAGIGITAGENMKSGKGPFDHEAWLWQTYGEGIRDALKDDPNRRFRLIHRYHQTAQKQAIDAFKDYPGPFDFSLKYSQAHMYSIPNPPYIKPVLKGLPEGMRTWLTVRNDDVYSFRWGDPDFARDYVRNIPGPEKMVGFYMGPDGYCWGREFIDREPETPRQLVMQKQWYSFMMWGRLAYDPDLPNSLFEQTLGARFPQVPAAKLYQACSAASKVFPQTTRFFWRELDFMWFPEVCIQNKGFFTVKDFAQGVTMPDSGILNIRQWRSRVAKGATMEGITPLQVAETLKGNAARALAMVAELRPAHGDNKELRLMLGDCEAMAHLGNYYSEKILAASDLALFDQTSKPEQQASAVVHLEAALEHWKKYAAVATSQYKRQHLARLGQLVDLNSLTAKVAEDISIAKAWSKGSIQGDGEGPVKGDTTFRP